MRIPASIRSASSARSSPTCSRDRRYPVGTQHDHAAAVAHVLPERRVQRRAAVAASAIVSPQGARSLHGADPRDQGDEGRDSRAVSERRLPRQPRIVRAARRRRSRAHLLRQGRQQPHAGRGRADCRRHPESVSALAVREQAIARRNGAMPCSRRWPRPTSSRATPPNRAAERADHRRRARRGQRSALLRRLPGDELQAELPGVTQRQGSLDVFTTLDLNLQRYAQEAVRERPGEGRPDRSRSARSRPAPAQAALIAMDPRTGEVLALVGGRFYNQSQFNRAIAARRQPGSTFKPFVYLAAFERAAAEGRTDLTPATLVSDEPTTWTYDEQEWSPRNYDSEYDGVDHAASRARACRATSPPSRWPSRPASIAWRALEAGQGRQDRPAGLSLDRARRLRADAARSGDGVLGCSPTAASSSCCTASPASGARAKTIVPKTIDGPRIAREDTTFLVTNMMRSVINEGTGAGARAAGFALDAAGKSGTTNDLRDAWFVGFTPELLAVVWVGFDDNTPLGLSGTQAALPIWTEFMKRALAGHANLAFEAPEGISFADIDRDTGRLALPDVPTRVERSVPRRHRTRRSLRSPSLVDEERPRRRVCAELLVDRFLRAPESLRLKTPGSGYNSWVNHEVFAALGEALKNGEDVALVTIVSANGSTPQRVGAKMLVYNDGRVVGTIGGGCYENEALWKAREVLKTRKACTARYELADDFAAESGLICGGQMEVFIEPIEPVASRLHLRRRPRGPVRRTRRARCRFPCPCRGRSREVRQPRAVSRRRRDRRGRHSDLAGEFVTALHCLCRRRHARPSPRSRRAARARAARPPLPRSDRQPRQGEAHLRRRSSRTIPSRSTASRRSTRPSALTSAPSPRRKSPCPSSPS